jgi:hypothetical protein
MKIEDVKKGMKLKPIGETAGGCRKGLIYTVSNLIGCGGNYPINSVAFEELSGWYALKFFEPANKFEIGDEVIFNDLSSFKAKILFIDTDDYCTCYLVKIDGDRNGKSHLMLRAEETLSPLKKKDELEAGDMFKSPAGTTYQILHVDYDNCIERKEYYCKVVTGGFEGRTGLFYANAVDEIIYDWENKQKVIEEGDKKLC